MYPRKHGQCFLFLVLFFSSFLYSFPGHGEEDFLMLPCTQWQIQLQILVPYASHICTFEVLFLNHPIILIHSETCRYTTHYIDIFEISLSLFLPLTLYFLSPTEFIVEMNYPILQYLKRVSYVVLVFSVSTLPSLSLFWQQEKDMAGFYGK